MQTHYSRKSKTAALILSFILAFACFAFMQTGTAGASAAGTDFTSYSIYSYSGSDVKDSSGILQKDLNQHVVIKLTFGSAVTIKDESALNQSIFGNEPTMKITIHGSSIASSSYYRPCTYSTDGSTLSIDIGSCLNSVSKNPVFTAIYAGSIVADGTLNGLTVGGTDTAEKVHIAETKIPTGVTIENVNASNGKPTWDTSTLTMKVTHVANIRCMFHFVLYKVKDASSDPVKVVPVTCTAGDMQAYYESGHAHVYYSMGTSDFAEWMANSLNSGFAGGYKAVASGDTVTIKADDPSARLRMYMFDDNYLQSSAKCKVETPDPKVAFVPDQKGGISGTLNSNKNTFGQSDGYVSYALTASGDPDGMPAWISGISSITVDGKSYTVTHTRPDAYNRGTKHYAYIHGSGSSYKLELATDPMECSGDITSHALVIKNSLFGSIAKNIIVNNVTVKKASIVSLKNKKKHAVAVKLKKVAGARGYVISYSRRASMASAHSITVSGTVNKIRGLKKGKKYFVRARAYKLDSRSAKVYGSWSSVKKIKIRR